ncbi:MAG TPA: ABC transporter permease [Catenuloplanes sp.]|jgi:simple sugar transport system permease protein
MTKLSGLVRNRLFWPVALLLLLLLSNLIIRPGFFALRMQDGHLYGSLIDILRFSAPLMLVALGMTLVIATGGIDLSVGSVFAIAGALACVHISTQPDQNSLVTVFTAIAIALGAALVMGMWNGTLVARFGVQPIIATLILMVAGRGVALLITGGLNVHVKSPTYRFIGAGYLFTLPFNIILAIGMVILAAIITRRSALGLLVESVGGNAVAARLVGIRARGLTIGIYTFAAFCAALAGIMHSSGVSSADGNYAGVFIELDAILAVVIGGTLLTGGRYSLAGTVVGVLFIQTLVTTIYSAGVNPRSVLVVKAVVVLVVCLMQSEAFRSKVFGRWKKPGTPTRPATMPGGAKTKAEVPA